MLSLIRVGVCDNNHTLYNNNNNLYVVDVVTINAYISQIGLSGHGICGDLQGPVPVLLKLCAKFCPRLGVSSMLLPSFTSVDISNCNVNSMGI